MLLSKQAIAFLACVLLLPFLQNCGRGQNIPPGNGGQMAETNREFPFSTREPGEFQGDFVRTSMKNSEHSFFARKGGKWRYDIFDGDTAALTVLQIEKTWLLLHKRAVYAQNPEGKSSTVFPDFVNDLTFGLLNQRKFATFEDLGSDGGIRRYRAIIDESESSEVLIDIDEQSGLIVKQEFLSRTAKDETTPFFRFELKNLKFVVDDAVFEIPKGYRKIAWEEFVSLRREIIK